MNHADKITERIEQMNVSSTAAMRDRILSDATQVMEQTIDASANKPSVGRIIMKSKMTKLTAAAVMIIAVLAGINMFNGTPVWADVLENISRAKSVVYKETSEIPKYTFTNVEMVSENGIVRSELEHGIILIMDVANKITLWLEPSKKEATRYGEPVAIMKKNNFSYIGWLRKLHEAEAEFAGSQELDGQMTSVYVWEVPFETITVWVNPEMNLPIKVEHKTFANTEKDVVFPSYTLFLSDFGGDSNVSASGSVGSSRGSGKGISQDTTKTMYDFEWDVELDPSLFSLEPPEGYTLQQKYSEDSPVDEHSLIHILQFWADWNDGQFPTEEQLNDPQAFMPSVIKAYDKDGDPEEEFDQARNEAARIVKGIYVVQEKKVDSSWGYAGEGVELGQAEMIVCWWYDEEKQGYQAVLGDLSVVEVLEDQLPIQP